MRLAAILVCAKCLFVPAVGIFLIHSLLTHENPMVYRALACVAGLPVIIFTQWIIASRTHCPLCMTPVLGNKQCNKHRRAKSLFGSYRLRVALQILTLNRFTCPYCSEPSELKLREPRRA